MEIAIVCFLFTVLSWGITNRNPDTFNYCASVLVTGLTCFVFYVSLINENLL